MMPRFSFCVGSCISVLEARLVSSCFSCPSSAAVRGWYQLIDLPTEWPPYLDPTYLCYWREEASTRTLYSGWTQSRGGTHPQTPLKTQIELISHCSLQKLESLSLFTSSSKSSIRRFVITEKAPTRAFSWLKAATTTFTF